MKYIYYFSFFLFLALMTSSCFDDSDDEIRLSSTAEINNFIWRGMNAFYVYKDDVPDLADDRFTSEQEFNDFLNSFSSVNDIFQALRTQDIVSVDGEQIRVDSFSFIVEDFIELEQAFDGISLNNGMEFGLIRYPNEPSNIFGYVRYVIPNTDAAAKGILRGNVFNTIDGIQITDQNFRELLAPDSYTIGLATFDGTNVTPIDQSVTLDKAQVTENPVLISTTLDVGGNPVGYIMYNSFTGDFDAALNNAFGELAADGVTDLVLDLRYNGGGSVTTAIDLSSMITGQFNGQIFSTEEWNSDRQEQFGGTNFFDTEIRNGAAINSLNLNRVYVLTTGSSASASELIINGLDPYIDVIQVGTRTSGKFQASITLYDSDNFRRNGANTGHTYAMQPLVLRSLNADGFTDYFNGFAPEVEISEDFSNLGILGDPNEPLLNAAISHILGNRSSSQNNISLESVGESKMTSPNYQRMYIDIAEEE